MNAKLIWSELKKNENGFPIKKNNEVDVFVEEKEVVRAEFYEAMRSGITVKKVFKVRTEDFELSKHVDDAGNTAYATEIEHEGETYKIVRAYERGKAKIELTCGEM